MGQQLYRRLPQAFVVEALEAFNDHRMTERQACSLLGLKRARLYELRREWLRQRATWALAAPRRGERRWSADITTWLHRECQYVQDEAVHYRGRFNFAVLAEAAFSDAYRHCASDGQGRLRPVPEGLDLALLFALQQERLVHSDGKVRFLGRTWPVSAPAGSQVTVCWRPKEQLVMLWNEQRVGAYAL